MSQAVESMEQTGKSLSGKEGKYLTFALGTEEYGLEIHKVREIIGYMPITAMPQMPPHVKGVINLRGQVIPVIDLRAKFSMAETDVTEETCIVVVEIDQSHHKCSVGVIVDRVSEVLDIAGENIEESPQFDCQIKMDFILGIGKIETSIKILLDIDKVLGNVAIDQPDN